MHSVDALRECIAEGLVSFVIGCAWKMGCDIFMVHGGFAGPRRTASATSL